MADMGFGVIEGGGGIMLADDGGGGGWGLECRFVADDDGIGLFGPAWCIPDDDGVAGYACCWLNIMLFYFNKKKNISKLIINFKKFNLILEFLLYHLFCLLYSKIFYSLCHFK